MVSDGGIRFGGRGIEGEREEEEEACHDMYTMSKQTDVDAA